MAIARVVVGGESQRHLLSLPGPVGVARNRTLSNQSWLAVRCIDCGFSGTVTERTKLPVPGARAADRGSAPCPGSNHSEAGAGIPRTGRDGLCAHGIQLERAAWA